MLNEKSIKEAYNMYIEVCKKNGDSFVSYEEYKNAIEENCKKQFHSYKKFTCL